MNSSRLCEEHCCYCHCSLYQSPKLTPSPRKVRQPRMNFFAPLRRSTLHSSMPITSAMLEKFVALLADDLEFYHDQGGLTRGNQTVGEQIKKNICGKVRRELVPGTLEVYPMQWLRRRRDGCASLPPSQRARAPSPWARRSSFTCGRKKMAYGRSHASSATTTMRCRSDVVRWRRAYFSSITSVRYAFSPALTSSGASSPLRCQITSPDLRSRTVFSPEAGSVRS